MPNKEENSFSYRSRPFRTYTQFFFSAWWCCVGSVCSEERSRVARFCLSPCVDVQSVCHYQSKIGYDVDDRRLEVKAKRRKQKYKAEQREKREKKIIYFFLLCFIGKRILTLLALCSFCLLIGFSWLRLLSCSFDISAMLRAARSLACVIAANVVHYEKTIFHLLFIFSFLFALCPLAREDVSECWNIAQHTIQGGWTNGMNE